MKQNFNYHTHTARCGHASGEDEQYILSAIKAGYKQLGMSDHRPYEGIPAPRDRMNWEQLEGYLDSMQYLKEKYREQSDIKIGLESEFIPESVEETVRLRKRVDYFILGQHSKEPEILVDYCFDCSAEDLEYYISDIEQGLDRGMYLYLAHPEYFMIGQPTFNEKCVEAAHRLAAKCAATGIPMEINLKGISFGKRDYGNGMLYPYPHRPFWEIVSQYPVKCIYGWDAHTPEFLQRQDLIEEAEKELQGLNLQFVKEPLL